MQWVFVCLPDMEALFGKQLEGFVRRASELIAPATIRRTISRAVSIGRGSYTIIFVDRDPAMPHPAPSKWLRAVDPAVRGASLSSRRVRIRRTGKRYRNIAWSAV